MGLENQSKAEEEKEGEIPVLTVLKNNTVLKNIFIVNKPTDQKQSSADHVNVLLVGRHPDCDLMLTHPSISRFHLQIRSNPSSRTFSLLDLSSGIQSLFFFLFFLVFDRLSANENQHSNHDFEYLSATLIATASTNLSAVACNVKVFLLVANVNSITI